MDDKLPASLQHYSAPLIASQHDKEAYY